LQRLSLIREVTTDDCVAARLTRCGQNPEAETMAIQTSSVSVVIPALNEGAIIGRVVRDIISRFAEIEVIVVNDGSSDDTAEKAAMAGAQVISHYQVLGYGAALRTGTEAATRHYVLFCDGDGQHRIEDIGRLIAECEGYDMVVGQRTATSHTALSRRPGKLLLRWFADFLAGERIPDINSGLRIFRRDVLLRYIHLMPQGFSFSTTSTFAMLKSHRRIKYVPITVKPRVGESTVRQWRHGPITLMLILRITVLFEPLKVFLALAGLLLALCILSVIINQVWGQGRGIADTTVLLFVSSLLVFLFGLLCDQVSAMRRDYRPQQ